MKKYKIKIDIASFVFGILFAFILMIIIYILFFNVKKISKIGFGTNNEKVVKINQNNYNIREEDYTYICEPLKENIWVRRDSYFITQKGELYLFDWKKYSETNSNCKLYDNSIKVKTYIHLDYDQDYIITEDNKVFRIFIIGVYTDIPTISITEIPLDHEEYNIISYFMKNNVKEASLFYKDYNDFDEETEIEFVVLKNDGILYKEKFLRKQNIEYKNNNTNYNYLYSLIQEEVLKKYNDEKIKSFEYERGVFGGYIITDKSVYTEYITNRECLEYNDIDCYTDFEYNDYFSKIKNSITRYDLTRLNTYGEITYETYMKRYFMYKK